MFVTVVSQILFLKKAFTETYFILFTKTFEATTYEIITTKFEILYHNFVIVPCSSQYNAIVQM